MNMLIFGLLGLAAAGGGGYFIWRGVVAMEAGGLVSGLVVAVIGLLVFRSGIELMKVGAAAQAASKNSLPTESLEKSVPGRPPAKV